MKARYVVNEEKRTVACIIYDCELDLASFITKHSMYTNSVRMYGRDYPDLTQYVYGLLKSSYSGVAKCSPEDEFSVEFGKNLAYKRARLKYEKDRMNVLMYVCNRYLDPIHKMINIQSKRLRESASSLYE